MDKIKIVLADDHTLVREGLRELLQSMSDMTVVGEAGDGLEAIEITKKHQPDVLIIDIAMPKMKGIEAIKEIKRSFPDIQILVLSMHSKTEYVRQTLKNGASGYMLKQSASEELKAAIIAILNGDIYLSPAISKSIIEEWKKDTEQKAALGAKLENLTDRERAVLKLLSEGYSNKSAAELLHISIKTVETHRHRIMQKLNLNSFADLVKYAIKEGYTEVL